MDLITILPVVTKDLPISPRFTPYIFLSRCKFSTLTTRQPMVEFYLLTFPRFPLRKKEHKSYFGKNRTHDFRNSRCTAYLLDHSGDEQRQEYGEGVPMVARPNLFVPRRGRRSQCLLIGCAPPCCKHLSQPIECNSPTPHEASKVAKLQAGLYVRVR